MRAKSVFVCLKKSRYEVRTVTYKKAIHHASKLSLEHFVFHLNQVKCSLFLFLPQNAWLK